jgi:hypothetical protein
MKFKEERQFANPEIAMAKLLEIANSKTIVVVKTMGRPPMREIKLKWAADVEGGYLAEHMMCNDCPRSHLARDDNEVVQRRRREQSNHKSDLAKLVAAVKQPHHEKRAT